MICPFWNPVTHILTSKEHWRSRSINKRRQIFEKIRVSQESVWTDSHIGTTDKTYTKNIAEGQSNQFYADWGHQVPPNLLAKTKGDTITIPNPKPQPKLEAETPLLEMEKAKINYGLIEIYSEYFRAGKPELKRGMTDTSISTTTTSSVETKQKPTKHLRTLRNSLQSNQRLNSSSDHSQDTNYSFTTARHPPRVAI